MITVPSNGYPESYAKGYEINIPDEIKENVYVAGAALKDGKLVTSGGRVLGAVRTAQDLDSAISGAYELVDKIHFDNAYFRHDIGARALACKKGD